MRPPLTTDRQRYYQLMALVCEDMSHAQRAIDALIRDGHEATSSQLMGVRFGRTVNLPWLIDLVRVSLPDFEVPHELLPVLPVGY